MGLQKGEYDDNGHSEWFGFGKINAARAVATAPQIPLSEPSSTRGLPRTQYDRVYILLPQDSGPEWLQAILASGQWTHNLWTVGYSADDAGIGDLQTRLVLAINPEQWGDDLGSWYIQNYNGAAYAPISANSPDSLTEYLSTKASDKIGALINQQHSTHQVETINNSRGLPRSQYSRTYLLMPQKTRVAYIQAIINSGVLTKHRWTIGFSADDAGIGDLDNRSVLALNPKEWGENLIGWYANHYPGVNLDSILVTAPGQLQDNLSIR